MTQQLPEVTYHDMTVGRRFTVHRFSVDAEQLSTYESLFNAHRQAPTGLLAVHARKSYTSDGPIPSGGVMAELSITSHTEFLAGNGYEFAAEVIEQFERQGKGWVRIRSELTRSDTRVATVEIVGVWPL